MSHCSGIPPNFRYAHPTAEGLWDLNPIPAIPRDSGDLFNLPFIASAHSTRLYLNPAIP
jgi:hypothetical protein